MGKNVHVLVMLGRQERLALILLLLVASGSVAAHLVLSQIGKRPFASPFSEQSRDGDLVIVSGTISELSTTRTGGNLIIEVNNLSVFIPGHVAASPALGNVLIRGSNITVTGTVQTYQGKKELVIGSPSDIVPETV